MPDSIFNSFVSRQGSTMIDKVFSTIGKYASFFFNELGDIARHLDGTGWAGVTAVLLVCGWFFLKGNKIRST